MLQGFGLLGGSGAGGQGGEEGTLTFACNRGSDYFVEFKILNFATGEPSKVQVRDLVRIVVMLTPLPHGV